MMIIRVVLKMVSMNVIELFRLYKYNINESLNITCFFKRQPDKLMMEICYINFAQRKISNSVHVKLHIDSWLPVIGKPVTHSDKFYVARLCAFALRP